MTHEKAEISFLQKKVFRVIKTGKFRAITWQKILLGSEEEALCVYCAKEKGLDNKKVVTERRLHTHTASFYASLNAAFTDKNS